VVHKPHVVSSLTCPSSKASLGAYSTYRFNNVSCLTLNACDILCTTYRVLECYDDRLHGSTPSICILV
jgi:hypothetical protein